MLLLSCSELSRAYSSHPLFRNIGFELRAGERVGLVGPNGAGKSTLMKLLASQESPDTGSVRLHAGARISLLKQHAEISKGRTLFDEAKSALDEFLAMQQDLFRTADELASCSDPAKHDALASRYDRLNELLRQHDAYSVDHKIEEVLQGLGFTTADYNKAVEHFSGGQVGRLMLAKLLLSAPDVMLLDEPSNHLDVDALVWLETYLVKQPEAMLIVSHDRYFLNRVVNKVFELSGGIINDYLGNFDQYWRLRQERYDFNLKAYEAQKEHIEKQEDYIRRNLAGQLSKQAQGRRKILERVERLQRPVMHQAPRMHFGPVKRTGDIVLQANNLSKSFEKPLFKNLSFQLQRGKRLGIYGPNGCGKSTLLSILLEKLLPDLGSFNLGAQVQLGFYDQHLKELNPDDLAIRAAWPTNDFSITEQQMRDLLGRFGLEGRIVFQKVSSLSGGEKSRVCLAKLVKKGSNFLILDEPTNHLDLWACDALEQALIEFEGTVLVVSHDRYFLNRIVDFLIVMDGKGNTRTVTGNFEFYEELLAKEQSEQKLIKQEKQNTASFTSTTPPTETKRKKKFPYRKVEELELEISLIEEEKFTLEKLLEDPALYRDGTKVKQTTLALDTTKEKLNQLYEHWEEAIYFQQK